MLFQSQHRCQGLSQNNGSRHGLEMKIVLINPPFLFPHRKFGGPSQCLGLRSLSAILKKQGHNVSIVDAFSEGLKNIKPYANGFVVGLEYSQVLARVPSDTELIGVGVPFSQLAPIAHELIALLRERFPNTRIVMGGVYPSTQPRLALTSDADLIIIGEGELAIVAIAAGKDPASIVGVYTKKYLKGSPVFYQAEMVANLDDLPFPDCDFPGIEKYFSSPRLCGQCNTASIVTSRGCPYACEFCSIHPVYGRKWRARSAKNVLEEIRFLYQRFGVKRIEFEDDNLTLDRDRAAEIFEGVRRLNEQGAGIHWNTPNGIRIDTLDEELIRLMKLSGCESIVLALEHGDPEMLRIMNKKLDLDVAYRTIAWCVRHDIPSIVVFVIVGYPGETRKCFEVGWRYLKRIQSLSASISIAPNIAQPYPGTKLLERCRANGYIKDGNIDNFLIRRDIMSTSGTVSITTLDFDAKEVLRRHYLLLTMMPGPHWKQILRRRIPQRLMNVVRKMRGFPPPSEAR